MRNWGKSWIIRKTGKERGIWGGRVQCGRMRCRRILKVNTGYGRRMVRMDVVRMDVVRWMFYGCGKDRMGADGYGADGWCRCVRQKDTAQNMHDSRITQKNHKQSGKARRKHRCEVI